MNLTQDEIVLFSRNFFCFRCGARTALEVSKEVSADLQRMNDRDRRPAKAVPLSGKETAKHVR